MKLRYSGGVPEIEASALFCKAMEELFAEDDAVVYFDADLMASMKTQSLWKDYPDRVFNCGIQEANMVGVAAGMYLAGFKPYIHSFAPFASQRVFDQVFLSIGYAHKKVHIIGSDVGIMATDNGGTHMCFEDIAMMRTVPGACVIDVTDGTMLYHALKITKDWEGLTYIRTPRRNMPDIYPKETLFEIGKGKLLADGKDVTLIASGIMVASALQARELLLQKGFSARVVDPVTIKPLDAELVLQCARYTGAVVTAENHNVIGGLGASVAELLGETCPVPVLKVGVPDSFGQVGTEMFLREQYGLLPQNIVKKAEKAIELKKRKG